MNDRCYTRRELLSGRVLGGLARRTLAATRAAVVRRVAPPPSASRPTAVAQRPPSDTAAAARRRTMPLLRPPGAVREERFLRDCTGCMDCATACPHGAIVEAPIRLREAAGTPLIVPEAAACHMCQDMPCIAACQPGVLDARLEPKIGTARVLSHFCMGTRGLGCSACVEHCPVDGAIRLECGTPVVDPPACTGCGVCVEVCPAPTRAILVLPASTRGDPEAETAA